MSEKTHPATVHLPADEHTEYNRLAAAEGISLSAYLLRAARAYVAARGICEKCPDRRFVEHLTEALADKIRGAE